MRRQLDVDVGAGAQRRGHLVAAAARAAHVDHDPQRVPGGDAGPPDELARRRPRSPAPRRSPRARAAAAASVPREQRLAVDRELAPRRVERGQQQRAGARRAHEPHRAATRAGVDAAARRDVQHRRLRQRADDLVRRGDAPRRRPARAPTRHAGVEAEVRPPRLVDDERRAGRVRDLGAGPPRRRPSRSRSARRRTTARGVAARARSAASQRVRRDAVRHAQLVVVLRRDERRHPAAQHEPVDQARVRVALQHHAARPGRREREAQRVVALRRAVREEPRRCAP